MASGKMHLMKEGTPFIQYDYEDDPEMDVVIQNLKGGFAILGRGFNPDYNYGKGANYRVGIQIKYNDHPSGEIRRFFRLAGDGHHHWPTKIWIIAPDPSHVSDMIEHLFEKHRPANMEINDIIYGEMERVRWQDQQLFSTPDIWTVRLPFDTEADPVCEKVEPNPKFKWRKRDKDGVYGQEFPGAESKAS